MKFNIRYKILTGFALLLVLSVIVQALTFSIAGDYIYLQKKNIQQAEANNAVDEIQTFFIKLNNINYSLARTYKLNSPNSSSSAETNLNSSLNTLFIENKHIETVTFLSSDGKELLKYEQINGKIPDKKLKVELITDELKKARTGNTAITKVYNLKTKPGQFIDIYSPVFINGKIPVVIRSQINLGILSWTVAASKLDGGGYSYIVDEKGKLIAHPSLIYAYKSPDLYNRKIISLTLKNLVPQPNEEKYKNEKNIIVTAKAARVPGLNWIVVFEQPVSEVLNFSDFMRNLFLVTLIGSLVVLLVIALLLSDNLTRPIRELQRFTGLLEKGELNNNINIQTGDEIESLANSFNSMASRLQQREDFLKKQKQEKETILQSLTDSVIALDSENKIKLFNKEAERITGLKPEFILDKKIDEALYFFEKDKQITIDHIKSRSKELILNMNENEIFLKDIEGKKIKISVTATPVVSESPDQNGWVITIHDLRKEQELEEMKIDFVSMAAHELRTPITEIRGYASLLRSQLANNLDVSGKELLNRLMLSAENLSDLTDNLLNISRIERDSFRVVLKPVDITPQLKNIVNGLRPQIYALNQKFELELPNESLPKILADTFRIGQVLSNLIINAMTYNQDGGYIKVKAYVKDNYLEISVSDNGIGISKESIPYLFTKFYRAQGNSGQQHKGTGLGLYICKSIIDMHKGKIWVESELNKGSVFTFAIPLAAADNSQPELT